MVTDRNSKRVNSLLGIMLGRTQKSNKVTAIQKYRECKIEPIEYNFLLNMSITKIAINIGT